jgi:hypothetical protein
MLIDQSTWTSAIHFLSGQVKQQLVRYRLPILVLAVSLLAIHSLFMVATLGIPTLKAIPTIFIS